MYYSDMQRDIYYILFLLLFDWLIFINIGLIFYLNMIKKIIEDYEEDEE